MLNNTGQLHCILLVPLPAGDYSVLTYIADHRGDVFLFPRALECLRVIPNLHGKPGWAHDNSARLLSFLGLGRDLIRLCPNFDLPFPDGCSIYFRVSRRATQILYRRFRHIQACLYSAIETLDKRFGMNMAYRPLKASGSGTHATLLRQLQSTGQVLQEQ
jgi:hypothetical protein